MGPHPVPQFEIHFTAELMSMVRDEIREAGLTALVRPLTSDDLADHTRLGQWIGTPIDLDLTVLDPPGTNQGLARFTGTPSCFQKVRLNHDATVCVYPRTRRPKFMPIASDGIDTADAQI